LLIKNACNENIHNTSNFQRTKAVVIKTPILERKETLELLDKEGSLCAHHYILQYK
jgi:hypothetical protein